MRLRGSYRLQILLGGLLGLTFGEGAASHAILVVSNALYFVALFYPVYSMVTMDGLALMNVHSLRPLVYLLYPPTFVVELLSWGVLGRQFDERPIVAVANLLYFVAFFYPVYSLAVMDRVVEASRCRLMKTVLILSVTLHFLLALFFALVMRA